MPVINKDEFSAFDKALKKAPVQKTSDDEFSAFDEALKKKVAGGQEQKPTGQAGTSPTQSPSQLPLTKVKWEENPLNPLAAVKKAEAEKVASEKIMPRPTPTIGKSAAQTKVVPQRKPIAEHEDGIIQNISDFGKYVWNKTLETVGRVGAGTGELLVDALSLTDDPNFPKEELIKNYREEIAPKIRQAPEKYLGAEIPKEKTKKFDDNFVTSVIGGVPGVIVEAAIPFGGGFIADAIDGGIQTINNTEEGKNLPESQKTIFGIGSGIAMGALTALGIDKIFGKQSSKVANKLAMETFSKLIAESKEPITKEIFEAAIKNNSKSLYNKVISTGGKLGESALVGALFTGGTEAANEVAKQTTNALTQKDVFDPFSWGKFTGNTIRSMAHGAATGFILGATTIPFSKAENAIKNEVLKAKSPADIENLKSQIIDQVGQGTLDPIHAESIGKLIDSYNSANAKVPPTIENREDVVDLIKQKDDLKQAATDKLEETKVVDDAFHPQLQQEATALLNRANELNESITGQPSEPAKSSIYLDKLEIPEIKSQIDDINNRIEAGGADGEKAKIELAQIKEDPIRFYEDRKQVAREELTDETELPKTLQEYDNIINKIKDYDKENESRLSGGIGVGQEPVTTEPKQGAGAEETGAGGVLQAPGAEGEGEGIEPKVGEEVIQKIPEEISSLKDDETITFRVKNIDEIPEEFRDRAVKKEGLEAEVRKKILGLPIGKKSKITFGEGYTYQLTGKEAKDYAESQLPKAELPQQKGEGVGEIKAEVPKQKEITSEPVQPIREEVSGAVQPAPEVPKGQEIKTGVQPSAEPISGRRAEAAPAVLEETKIPEHNKDNQPEFITSSGRQKVNRVGDELVITDSKTGKKVSRSTEKKAISEYVNNFDFTHGEEGESTTISEDPNKMLEQVVETSSNPHQLAVIYAENNLPFAETVMDKNGMISEYGIGKISLDSFRRFGDINKLTPKIRANYIAKKGDIAESIDTYAKELSEHYFPDGDGTEISPQDIVDFMEKYESKKELRNKGKSQLLTDIEDKFKKLTGLKLTVEVANKAIEQKIQKESQLEQNLLKQDYENQQQLENEYWKQYKATDGFTKEVSPTEIDRGKEIIAKEGAKIETEIPEQYKTKIQKIGEGLLSHLGIPIESKEGEVKFSKITGEPEVLTPKENKEKEILDQMNSMSLVNKKVNISSPSTTKEKINVNELNSRLDNPLSTVKWEDFEGMPFTFTISDQLRTGDIKNPNTGEVITDLKGGIGFNGTKGNENNAWANTTKEEAEGTLQRAKDVYENNKPLFEKLWKEGKLPDGHIPMAVVKMAETSILSNEAVFRTGIQNIETIPKSNRKKAVSELAKSMKAKIDKESESLKRGVDKNGKPYTANTIKLKKKSIVQYQKILDAIKANKYEDIVNVLKDNNNFSLPEKTIIANEIFYGDPNPAGTKSKTPGEPKTRVSVSLLKGLDASKRALINLSSITDLLTEPSMKDVPNMHIVSIVGVDVKNPNVNKINHTNYPYGVKGKSIGILESPIHMKDAFGEAYGSALGQVVKNEAANASISVKNALTQGIPVQSGLPNRVFKSAIAKGKLDAVDKLAGFLRQAFPNTTFFTSKDAWDAAMSEPGIKKKLKDGDVVYAFTTDGNIFINPELKTTKATLHETGHIWMGFVKENNPELHSKGLDLVAGTKEHQKAINEYGDTELAREEALMELMSTKGETILNASQKAQFKEWLLSVYKYIADNFKSLMKLSPKEVENLTLDKFLEGMLSDILSGKELTTKKIKGEVKFSIESQESKIKDYIDSQRKAGESEEDIRAGIESVADKIGLTKEDIDSLMSREVKAEVPKQKVELIEAKPPAPPTITTKGTIKGEEGSIRGIIMEHNAERRKDLGMPERQPNPETFEQWDNEAKKLVEDGYNINKLIEKMESGEATTPVENSIRKIFAATIDKELLENPSDEFLAQARRFTKASDVASSQAGKNLVSLKGNSAPLESITDFYMAKMDANGVDVLTEQQKKDVQKEFEKINKLNKEYEEKLKEAEAKNAELLAQNELIKQQKGKAKPKVPKQKKDFTEERQSLKEQLKQAIQTYKNNANKLGISSDGGAENFAITVDMAKIIGKIVKSHVEEVGAKLSEVTKRTLEDVKDLFDGITEKDIRDIIAGKYSEKKKTKSQLQADLNDIKSEAKLLDEYERVLKGEAKTEKEKIKKNQKLTDLRKSITELKKEKGIDEYSDEAKIEKAKDAVQKNISELERRLRENDIEFKKKKSPTNSELESYRNKQKDLRKELEERKKEEKVGQYSDEAKAKRMIEANKKKEQQIREKLANEDFEKEDKPKTLFENKEFKNKNPQLYKELLDSYTAKQDALHEYEVALLKDSQAKMSKGQKVLDFSSKAVNTTKKLVTGVDDSALFMQTLVAMMSRPVIGGKAFVSHIKEAASQKLYERNLAELHNSPIFDLMQKSGLDITEPKTLSAKAKEEAFAGESLDFNVKIKGKKHKVLGTLLEPFERAFTSLGNNMRAIAFTELAEKYINEGHTFENNPKLFKDLATMLNTETGRGKQNEYIEKASKLVTTGIWSPRLMASRLNLLGISDLLSPFVKGTEGYYRKLSPEVRKQAIYSVAKFAAAIIALSYSAAYMFNGEVDDDPTSQGFMDIKIGNKTYNIAGGFSQYIRLIAQTIAGGKTSDGKFKEFKSGDRTGNVLHFLRGKLTPVAGVASDVMSGMKDYVGQPVTIPQEIKKLTIPLSMQGVATEMQRDGIASILKSDLPSFVGIGVKDIRDFKTKDLLSEEELDFPGYEIYKNKGVEMPAIGTIKQIKVSNRPDGVMTEDDYSKYKELVKKYMKEGFKYYDDEGDKIKVESLSDILNTTWEKVEYKKKGQEPKIHRIKGRDLDKDELQEKINSLKEKASNKAKEELGLLKKSRTIIRKPE